MKNVLIINAHLHYPEFSEGNLTKALIETATEVFENNGLEVNTTKIEDGYDPNEEMEKHLWADLVILQTPVNWMSALWIYKKYADEVFNAGLFSQKMVVDDGRTRKDPSKQYGSGGVLQGRNSCSVPPGMRPKKPSMTKARYFLRGRHKRMFSSASISVTNSAEWRSFRISLATMF